MATEKQIKAALKEGGKKGQDIAGLADMGCKFFHVTLENCIGSVELVEKAMEGANREVEEGAEDRKGGAGEVAKMLLSAGDEQLVAYCHVPESLKEQCNINEWVDRVVANMGEVEYLEKTETMIKFVAKKNKELGQFPLKMRDEAINFGYAFLKEKMLVPDDDSDDDGLDGDALEQAGIEW
eukprot:m.94864 g.94864  ORF g.94864 m.94864 type:complete len:181 (+) comp13032_c0_seq1:498-1040(+)